MDAAGGQSTAGAGPYDGLGDEEVLAKAADAFRKARGYPPGSMQRAVQWAVYDAATAELTERLGRHLIPYPLAMLAERARGGGDRP